LEKDGKRMLSDMFHDHNGDLKIQVNPINGTSKAAATTIRGGLYHFIVRVETVDSDYTLLPYNQEPTYDSWLSIGPKNNLVQLADQVNKNGQASTGLMKFTLQSGGTGEAAGMSLPMSSMGSMASGK
jgi:hypothetical protein